MTGQEFLRAVTVAFIATFVATVYGYWEVLFGLPKLDFASVLGRRLVPEGSSPEFVFNWGMAQHFIDSIILGILYAQFFHPAYRWSHWASGMTFGILVWIASGVVTAPLFRMGFFWSVWGDTAPLGVFLWHLLWGLALGTALRIGEKERHPRRRS
jgi:hypothetical protein